MPMNRQIDALIEAGWQVLESNFSEAAFRKWRKEALKEVALLCGAGHVYTDYFQTRVEKSETGNVLADIGVLTAAGLSAASGTTPERHAGWKGTAPIDGASLDDTDLDLARSVQRHQGEL